MAKDETKPEAAKEERMVVSLAELKKEFGPKAGEEKYRAVRNTVHGTEPLIEPNLNEYAPDIALAGIKPETRAAVSALLTAKE